MSKPKLGPNSKCHYCGALATTRDHVVPKAVGGGNSWRNLVPACEPCNSKKADSMPDIYHVHEHDPCHFCRRALAHWKNVLAMKAVEAAAIRKEQQQTQGSWAS